VSLALYRRYRPETFEEVIGQEHVTGPLQQALRSDRVHHAYLFSGPRGCGKTTSARILARALNCETGPRPDPCGKCQSCLDLARDGAGSLDVVEIDAASHGGVDDARDLRERAFYAPASSRYKIYIIDEAHMVTPQGFNALLKVVEEPPAHLKFIFATTEPERVLGTIRSRTHHYPFRLVPPRVLQDYLQHISEIEGVTVGPGVLAMVVRAGAGSVRDALSVLDQLISGAGSDGVTHAYAASLLGYTDAALLDDVIDAFAAADGATVFEMVDRVVNSGIDPRRFVADLLERLRDLLILQAVPDGGGKGLLHAPADQLERMLSQAGRFGAAELARAAEVVNNGLTELRGATAPRLQLELICARVLLPGADADAELGMGARLDRLERRMAITASPAQAAPAQASPTQAGPAQVSPAQAGPVRAPVESGREPERQPAAAPVAEAPAAAAAQARAVPLASDAELVPEQPSAPLTDSAQGLDLPGVRQIWPAILDQVKQQRRLTWVLLFDKAQVLGVDERTLTIGLPDAGSVKAFSSSGHDAEVRKAIVEVIGAEWRIEAVHVPGQRPPAPGPPGPAAAGPVGGGSPSPAPLAHDSDPAHESDETDDGTAGAELVARELGGQVIDEFRSP
jgi:DNA polymerase III subunit gamma/tau